MKVLNLSKCKTNEEVCRLISKRVSEISLADLQEAVSEEFVKQDEATETIYLGLSMSMNVFLSGPGGYGKSGLVKFILAFYKIPFQTIVGYKEMPVEALLGIPNMDKLVNESEYVLEFKKSIFCTPGVLIGEEFTDVRPDTAAALKDILTEKGFRGKDEKVESLIGIMIIAANKSAKEIADDASKKAFYEERFPLQREVVWKSFTADDYYEMLLLRFNTSAEEPLFFMAKLFEDNHINHNITCSPRKALDITAVYLAKGISFLKNFSINVDSIKRIEAEAKRDLNRNNVSDALSGLIDIVDNVGTIKDRMLAILYAKNILSKVPITDDVMVDIISAKEELTGMENRVDYSSPVVRAIDVLFEGIIDD